MHSPWAGECRPLLPVSQIAAVFWAKLETNLYLTEQYGKGKEFSFHPCSPVMNVSLCYSGAVDWLSVAAVTSVWGQPAQCTPRACTLVCYSSSSQRCRPAWPAHSSSFGQACHARDCHVMVTVHNLSKTYLEYG